MSVLYYVLDALQVNEQPGSYLWHDHSASNRADGLQGALIVLPRTPEALQYDEERTLFVNDWFHGMASALRNNRLTQPIFLGLFSLCFVQS